MARARWQLGGVDGPRAARRRGAMSGPSLQPVLQPALRAQTLGATVLLVGNVRLDPSAGTIFAIMLRVVYSPGYSIPRDVLLRNLWPGQAEARSRASLRQALYKLRGTGLQVGLDGEVVSLDPSQVTPVFATHRTHERFEQDVTCGHEPFGPLLPGYATGRAAYDEWLTDLREGVHADVRRVLVEQLRTRRGRADWMGADALARWLLQFDPLNEEATITRAECTALNGSKAEAVAILDRFLAELGPDAGDLRLQATIARRRISEPPGKQRVSFAPTERHFIGREELMAELTLAMRRAKWHDGSATLLHGPPGMGKTRVTQELSKVAVIEGFRVVSVSCRESDQQRPLSVFLDLVPELLEMPGAMGCAPESMQVLRRLVQFIALDTPTQADSSEVVEAREFWVPPMSQTTVRRSVLDVLAAVSHEHPVLLVVDDAQWLDSASVDVLLELMQQITATRTCVMLVTRDDVLPQSFLARVGSRVTSIALPPLANSASMKLALAVANDFAAAPNDELLYWFARASEGCPLFLRTLVHHWVETGDAGGVPPTLATILTRRISELSSRSRRVVEAVCLLGTNATVDTIREVLDLSVTDTITALTELHERGALTRSSQDLVEVHDLVASAVRASLSALVRSTLHRRIGTTMLKAFDTTGSVEQLFCAIQQLYASGDAESTLGAIRSNLIAIASAGRPTQALALLEIAAGLEVDFSENSNAVNARMRIELEAGEYGRALALWTKGNELPCAGPELSEQDAEGALTHVDSAYRADALVDPNELAGYCIDIGTLKHLTPATRLRASEIGLIIASNTCDPVVANELYLAARACGDSRLAHDGLARVQLIFHTMFGDADFALRLATERMKRALSSADSSEKYTDLCRSAFAMRLVGSTAEALRCFEIAYEVAHSLKLARLGQFPAWQCAAILRDAGKLDKAVEWEEVLFQLVAADEDKCASNFVSGHACKIAIDNRDFASATQLLGEYQTSLPRLAHARAAAYADALRLGVLLIDDSSTIDHELLLVAEKRHTVVAKYGTSDFLSSVIVRAKLRCEGSAAARHFAEEYVSRQRRERTDISMCLSAAIRAL